MPVLRDHPEEMDRVYTPLEAKRRARMRIKSVKYGFFPVGSPSTIVICESCDIEITGQKIIIFGKPYHYDCYRGEK